ncbi:RpiR family transcriptional regulator [Niallia circulans]|uniref:MurR/RpiR family transcriptional regulator n=1 Tax=Niallia TaxID=2837506 RepID=UPI00077C8585|nr:MurR/RpiR family transcriptional regulator [Niallia circulans]MED3837492.1 MurR/RpiR family transcriptional regulator [Niallia circulans]MED4245025.1 MurR/RpiR family transcriptional regulator [Niallia circulans]MED4247785.1 MurR/RpiR family transcriptional regulator [Niallia circulans]QKH60260.1 MurR/RpiR family transcriptional regulator [Niallia circulans]SPU12826.1 RpiR family transcriptional regulator [Niallia circulans]
MEQLIYTLLAYINNSLEKDINYSIANSFLENIHHIEGYSLEMAAEVCNVAPSTINRFCKRIGFRNFSNLRSSVAYQGGMYEEREKSLTTETFELKLKENIEMMEGISKEQLDRIIKKIHESKRIVILGFEKHQIQAMELQKQLFLLGKLCECNTNFFKQLETVSHLTEEDMIITISIEGNILTEALAIKEKIKAANGKKLLITFSDPEKHQQIFEEIIQCGKIDNSAVSSYTLLRLFDILIYHYQKRYPSF